MKNVLRFLASFIFSSSRLAATLWQNIYQPVNGFARSMRAFANGRIIGAQPRPLQSDSYQVMRQDQRRYFGHPTLITFIHRFSNQIKRSHLGKVLIGDIAMTAGSPFSHGHASHQNGLDVDIWLKLAGFSRSETWLLVPLPLD